MHRPCLCRKKFARKPEKDGKQHDIVRTQQEETLVETITMKY